MSLDYSRFKVDIEVYEEYGNDAWAQAKYLAHSYDDCLWTNNLEHAVSFIKDSILNVEDTDQ